MQGSPLLNDDAPASVPAGTAQQAPAPLITGEALYLWTGAGAVIVVAVLMFILLGRWRAGRKAREVARNTDFFQPAGEGAEITFDDSTPVVESVSADDFQFPEPEPAPKKKKSSPFSGLFGRREKAGRDDAQAAPEILETGDEGPEFAAVEIDRSPAADHHGDAVRAPAADWDAIEREARRREEEAQADVRWRAMEDERQRRLADEDHQRTAERGAASRMTAAGEPQRYGADAPAHAAHDDIVRTLSEVEEALHVQREAIQAETRNLLDSFARRFSDRLDALARSMDQRSAHRVDAEAYGRSADAAALDDIARRLDEHRNEVAGALSALAKRFDQQPSAQSEAASLRGELAEIRKSLNGSAAPSAPTVQLADIVQNALAPGGYEFNALLANNRRADCLIRLARPPGPIAIDARFPVEAFHTLHERRSAAAESEFRRIALRHIVDVAERLISPGFTADSAILFLPNENMATELHARFPDVIQDSYRARVWIVSPTTLMATLHTMSAFLRDIPRRDQSGAAESTARRALSEVERLGERLSALEKNAAAERPSPRDLPSAIEAPEWRPETAAKIPAAAQAILDEIKVGDLYTDDDADTRHQTQARPPFPLR